MKIPAVRRIGFCLPAETDCQIRIFLGESAEAPLIETIGRIQRVDEKGMAIGFTQIAVEGFDYLRELIIKNTDQVQKVEDELHHHIGIKKRETL